MILVSCLNYPGKGYLRFEFYTSQKKTQILWHSPLNIFLNKLYNDIFSVIVLKMQETKIDV